MPSACTPIRLSSGGSIEPGWPNHQRAWYSRKPVDLMSGVVSKARVLGNRFSDGLGSITLSTTQSLHQRRNLDRRKIGEGVRDGIGQNDLVAMAQSTAAVDHIGDIPLPFGLLGANKRLTRSGKNFGGVLLVEKNRADRILSDGPDAVSQQQPPLVNLDRRSAIAHLHEFPREHGLQNEPAAIPGVDIVGIEQIKVFVVLPPDHCVTAID